MSSDPTAQLRRFRALVAPGTPLRDGLERVLRGRTGALVVLGTNKTVEHVSTGGFQLDTPLTPMALRELAKMDGALVLSSDLARIVAAGVQLMPDAAIDTLETGTRHRTADRVARQTGLPAVTVSASMSTIALFLPDGRHPVEPSDLVLGRAHQALQTLERYANRLWTLLTQLSSLEVQDQVTVKDVVLVMQRLEMVRRLELELDDYVLSLGTDGRLLDLQMRELDSHGLEVAELLERDYSTDEGPGLSVLALRALDTTELLEPLTVARAAGFSAEDHLDRRLTPRGHRQVAQIQRLPASLGERLLEHFGGLQALFSASKTELQEVEGVGEQRARAIRDGLIRVAEAAYTERLV
ncbi:DNA integrity scanning diadenylate cyclase DisA [Auraticoccus monumenti]|uniref:Diadenylate cyclase n=1 Tax=Auraticoccus monumenti TaxID=675864 RepID=A0A1G6RR11_9ACTN|nr:DNA integrity scanning diadenylate cyclase DisA [Auraticoccus monumenti]SDD07069.1 diadenylate cyclase [Auraticoccus monumenti]